MEVKEIIEVTSDNIYDKLWSGGRDTLDDLTDEQIDTVLTMLEEENCGESMTLTELNDFFWFERNTIAQWLGYNNYAELMKEGENNDR